MRPNTKQSRKFSQIAIFVTGEQLLPSDFVLYYGECSIWRRCLYPQEPDSYYRTSPCVWSLVGILSPPVVAKRWLHSACRFVDITFTWKVCALFQIMAAKVKETNTALHKCVFTCAVTTLHSQVRHCTALPSIGV